MTEFNDNFLYICLIVLLIFVIISTFTKVEKFSPGSEDDVTHGTEDNFITYGVLGEQLYDLRGFPLHNRPLYDCWNNEYRNCYNSNL